MSNNTKYGTNALKNNKGKNNSAFGSYAGLLMTDPSCNTVIGYRSLNKNTTGINK